MHKTAASPFQRIFREGGSQAVRELCEEPLPPPSSREIVYFKVFRYRCFEFTLLGLRVTFEDVQKCGIHFYWDYERKEYKKL